MTLSLFASVTKGFCGKKMTSYFKTLAAGFLLSAQLYPLNQGATLILSTAMAAVFFGEKPNAKCIAGILCAFVGLIVMNVRG